MEKPIRVLVIHEEADDRTLICNLLAADGCRPSAADTVRHGLRLARLEPPDLIVMDLPVPDLMGHELLQGLGRDLRLHHVPVICLTSVDPHRVFPSARSAAKGGAEHGAELVMLRKPLVTAELLDRVRALTARCGKRSARPLGRRGR